MNRVRTKAEANHKYLVERFFNSKNSAMHILHITPSYPFCSSPYKFIFFITGELHFLPGFVNIRSNFMSAFIISTASYPLVLVKAVAVD